LDPTAAADPSVRSEVERQFLSDPWTHSRPYMDAARMSKRLGRVGIEISCSLISGLFPWNSVPHGPDGFR
jgi:hypothetical protein